MQLSTLLPVALAVSSVNAVYQGFNYGSTFTDNSPKQYQDFVNEFKAAQSLPGTSGFTSARLYTMVQAGSTSDPISALKAAQDTQTSLLLGVWASAGDGPFGNEMNALKAAIAQYPDLAKQIAGISVGSEDLYRISPIGVENKSGVGAGPDVISKYISQVRDALKGSSWSSVQVGHVDTWTAWVNGSNSAVVQASDFIGVDAYPYFQSTMSNGIDNGKNLFNEAYAATQGAAQGKPVWITETGWPTAGPKSNLAEANTANAKTYWDQVGCPNFGKVNTWWYTLQDAAPTTPSPTFGLVSTLGGTPAYDLSCANVDNSTSTASASATGSDTAVPTAGGVSPSNNAGTPQYSNTTMVSTINGQPTTIVASTLAGATGGSASPTSGSGSSGGSGSGSGSGTAASATPSSFTGAASTTLKGSVVGILGALAAAVMLL